VVQGVGFRPFVYNLAHSLGLSGYVFNSSSGVTIEIEGDGPAVETFLQSLKEDPPQLAEITEISVSEMAVAGGAGFSILASREEAGEFVLHCSQSAWDGSGACSEPGCFHGHDFCTSTGRRL